MQAFPVELIKPQAAKISSHGDSICIEIPIAPFELNGEWIKTAVKLDGIRLPTTDFAKLERRSFRFPLNPAPGYIDGSVYIQHAHHPVDVDLIVFGDLSSAGLPITVEAKFIFEFEGLDDYSNTSYIFHTIIEN